MNALDVTRAFGWGLGTAQLVDAVDKQITFSDGSGGKLTKVLSVLWLTDQERIVRTHSHGSNYVLWNQAITIVARASDIPQNAALAANCYLDICNPGEAISKQYRIDSAFVENEVWQIDVQVFRSSNH